MVEKNIIETIFGMKSPNTVQRTSAPWILRILVFWVAFRYPDIRTHGSNAATRMFFTVCIPWRHAGGHSGQNPCDGLSSRVTKTSRLTYF